MKLSLRKTLLLSIAAFVYTLFAGGCASLDTQEKPLRVGITADQPPLVFRNGGEFVGAEVDLARALGEELGRPIQFVNVRWNDQIPMLLDGQTDIIMSAMSITEARRLRVAFTDPYMKNELRAIFRQRDATRFTTAEAFMASDLRVGVVSGTTSDTFVQRNGTRMRRTALESRQDVAFLLLRNRRIDAYVDDTAALAWILAENESSVGYLREPLAEEYLAWAVRRGNEQLLTSVNAVLAKWKADGTLNSVLYRWMPFLEQLQ